MGEPGSGAAAVGAALRSHPSVAFWLGDLSHADVDWAGVHGHRQVTGAYLEALARHRGGRLITFDAALARLRPDDILRLDADAP